MSIADDHTLLERCADDIKLALDALSVRLLKRLDELGHPRIAPRALAEVYRAFDFARAELIDAAVNNPRAQIHTEAFEQAERESAGRELARRE